MNSVDFKTSRKLASLPRQILIIMWKNSILFRRNKCALLSEIAFSTLFTFIFVILVNFYSPVHYERTYNIPQDVISANVEQEAQNAYLYYYHPPQNKLIEAIMNKSVEILSSKAKKFLILTPTELANPNDFSDKTKRDMFAFVSFPMNYSSLNGSNMPDQFEYSIYTKETNKEKGYKTDEKFLDKPSYLYQNPPEFFCQTIDLSFKKYATLFNLVKHSIDMSLIAELTNTTIKTEQVKISEFDCPDYDFNMMKGVFGFLTPILISLAFLTTFLINVSNIITEKETKMKEYLRLVGVKPLVIWICWLIRSLIVYLIISYIVSKLGTYQLNFKRQSFDIDNQILVRKALFLNTEFFVLFSTCLGVNLNFLRKSRMFKFKTFFFTKVYSFQVTCLSILVGQIFKKTFSAKTISIIAWLITLINFYNGMSSFYKLLLCICPNLALNFAIEVIFQYERSNIKLASGSLFTTLFDQGPSLGVLLLAMIFWSIFYLILSWYIERVSPGEYGVKLPYHFPFMWSYWFENSLKNDSSSLKNFNEFSLFNENLSNSFEAEPNNMNASVKIRNLTKIFDDKKVVNGMSVNFYENQITGFLGHNGAGKTTVTFMLCGLYSPNSGTAYMLGYDIRKQMNKIRSLIGFCPQQNILYDDLTVYQHFDLIASIKGFSRSELKSEILRIAKFVGLENDLTKTSKQLSGGMKRRLSFGIALIGDSKIIILDEPTSGLDPYNRRMLWELIRKYKQGRTIILTTHYMEEADALSDRIALMNHGKLKCVGSPLFLKDNFGSGYRLILTKNESFFNRDLFDRFFFETVGIKPIIESNISKEMRISIPSQFVHKLSDLLEKLDSFKKDLGVLNYGISSPTIEEIFLKFGSIDSEEYEIQSDLNETSLNDNSSTIYNMNTSGNYTNYVYFLLVPFQIILTAISQKLKHLILKNKQIIFCLIKFKENTKRFQHMQQQLRSLMLKRFIMFKNRWLIALFTLAFPCLITAFLSYLTPSSSLMLTNFYKNSLKISSIPSFDLDSQNLRDLKNIPFNIIKSNDEDDHMRKFLFDYQSLRQHVINDTLGLSVNEFVYKKRKENIRNLVNNYFVGVDFRIINKKLTNINMYYSGLAFHSSALILNEVNSFLLAFYTKNINKSIKTVNRPYNIAKKDSTDSAVLLENLDIINCLEALPSSFLDFILGIIIAFCISISVIHLTREKRNGSKSLQLLSGTHFITYWTSNYLFDFMINLFSILSIASSLKFISYMQIDQANDTYLIASDLVTLSRLVVFLLLTCFSWSTLAYIWSFFFKSDIIAFIVLFLVLSFATLLDWVLVLIKFFDQFNRPIDSELSNTSLLIDLIRYLLKIFFPNIAAKSALFNLKLQKMGSTCLLPLNFIFKSQMKETTKGFALEEPGIGKYLLLNFVSLLIGIWILYLIEKNFFTNIYEKCRIHIETLVSIFKRNKFYLSTSKALEEDVEIESKRIKNLILEKASLREPLIVKNLVKEFKKNGHKFKAVDNLNFGVLPTECFGLLGLNGAGKTTTLEILTGQLNATSGEAYLNGFNIKKNRLNAARSLGYCPQFDCLPEFLSVKQSLELFSNLRCIDENKVTDTVNEYLKVFKLNEFENKLVQNLSGGNKRKVSSAIAFIGKPKTVILDEPTSGVDPAARRYLWSVIKKARDLDRTTILLTTHSMDECEALCTKLGIMAKGQFECYGNIQNLKSKFGIGYTLIIKCKTYSDLNENAQELNETILANVENFISEKLKNAVLKDKQHQTLFYQIFIENKKNKNNDDETSLAQIFKLIETNKVALKIETYSLSQATLDQIFLSFAKTRQLNETNDRDLNASFSNNTSNPSVALNIREEDAAKFAKNNRRKQLTFENSAFGILDESATPGSENILMKDL